MTLPTHVSNDDVKRLTPDQLVKVLWQLVNLELAANGLHKHESSVPLSIYIKDGGIDGLAQWNGAPKRTSYLPSQHVGFQSKATELDESQCAGEVKTSKGKLKSQVRVLMEKGGHYVLFMSRDCVEASKKPRREAIKKAIEEASRSGGDAPIVVDETKISILDASDIAAWINVYPAAVAQVSYFIHRQIGPAIGWEEMSGYPDMAIPYKETDQARIEAAAAIREETRRPRSIVRVLGLSGLGKTRFLFEIFRPLLVGTPPTQAVPSDFCYVRGETTDLVGLVREWRRSKRTGVLVVDDCPIDLHSKLRSEIKHNESGLSLVTVGNDLDPAAYSESDTKVIKIEPISAASIRELLDAAFPEVGAEDREFIAQELAQGYPLMAIRVAEARKDNVALTARLGPEVLEKLLGIPAPKGSTAEKVISAFSLFENVGVYGDLDHEREFVRKTFCPDVSAEEFFGILQDFQKSGAISRYGRLMQVRPRPLAIRLAADWWARCSPELAVQIVGLEFPANLSEAFCQRLRMLDFVPALKETAEKLCGGQGPFGQAKVLRSELGSRLFRAIAEVNPLAAVKALENVFGSADETSLQELQGEPRRNIVLALEKLCFPPETFTDAARLLGRLATAENERWANNATGNFARLFMILLPGTQASLAARLPIVRSFARSRDSKQQLVAIEALENAIRTHNFTGTSGPELQGSSSAQQEYRPKVWGEVYDYWSAALTELTTLATSDAAAVSERAASAIACNLRGLIQSGRLDDVDAAIEKVAASRRGVWPAAMDNLRDSLRFEGKEFPHEVQERIASWLNRFEPEDLKGKLRIHVTDAPYQSEEDEHGEWQDLAAKRAVELGVAAAGQWEELHPLLMEISSGKQHQAYTFGQGLARGSQYDPQRLSTIISSVKQVELAKRNVAVLSGWLVALDQHDAAQVDTVLQQMAHANALPESLPQILLGVRQTDDRLALLIRLLHERTISPNQLHGLANGRALNDVSAASVVALCDAFLTFGAEGAWVTIDVASMYAYDDKDEWLAVAPTVKRALLHEHLLAKNRPGILIDAHLAARGAKSLLVDDAPFARALAQDVVDGIVQPRVEGRIEFALADILAALLEHQLAETWPALRAALSRGGSAQFMLRNVLRGRVTAESKSRLIAKVPTALLREWCEESPEVAPYILAGTIGASEERESGRWVLSEPAMMLIDRYGESSDVLSALAANLNTFSWAGSVIPFYERQVDLLTPLTTHPIEKVRLWADNLIGGAREQIKKEKEREEEQGIGRYQ